MSLDYVEYPEARTIEFTVVGRVTQDDYEAVVGPMQAFLDKYGSVRLMEVVKNVGGFDPAVLMPGLRFDLHNLERVSHVAVVSDVGWISPIIKAVGSIRSTRLRLFDMEDLSGARRWVMNAEESQEGRILSEAESDEALAGLQAAMVV